MRRIRTKSGLIVRACSSWASGAVASSSRRLNEVTARTLAPQHALAGLRPERAGVSLQVRLLEVRRHPDRHELLGRQLDADGRLDVARVSARADVGPWGGRPGGGERPP